jgi:sterol 3beta-glucosyltransferase
LIGADILWCSWFLDNPNPSWVPPADLERFMARAREDERPLVYIGFGSITVPDPKGMTKNVIEAVESSESSSYLSRSSTDNVPGGVRAIICQGWSARMVDDEAASGSDEEAEYPDSCYVVKSIPHDWLFPNIDAALHHGGAGTTGATLRAGIPTLIKPWFG